MKPILLNPSAKAVCIILHGLGDSGHGWLPFCEALSLFTIKFVLPFAPPMPITVNGGYTSPGWYDIRHMNDIMNDQDTQGMLKSAAEIKTLIDREIESGIPSEKILIAGFSQGAVMAMLSGLTYPKKLAGILAMSGYLPVPEQIFTMAHESNKNTPILICHGTDDEVVPFMCGITMKQQLEKQGHSVDFKPYPGVGHGACQDELKDVKEFLESRLLQ